MFITKIHKTENTKILAVIDENLLGKKIEEENKILNLNAKFYDGERKTKQEVIKLIKKCNQINAVGKEIIKLLKEEQIIETNFTIKEIPYSQIIII